MACVVNVDVGADHTGVLGILLAKTRQAQTHMDRKRDAQTRKKEEEITYTQFEDSQEPYEVHLGLRQRWGYRINLIVVR